jgi:hypothetical protein
VLFRSLAVQVKGVYQQATESIPPRIAGRGEPWLADPGGARGSASRREFDPNNAGGPIRQPSPDKVRIIHRSVDLVECLVHRFGPDRANEVMIERLRAIADGKTESTPAR